MKVSKLVCSVAVCLAGCALSIVVPVAAQENRQQAEAKDLPPSPLEAFAARSTAKVVWSKTIGHLESREAHATLTVISLEDRTTAASMMRGVRIDLAHTGAGPGCDWKYLAWRIMCERPNASVYVEEGRLEEVRNGIVHGAAELRPFEFISKFGKQDASRVWSTGLIVCGYQFSDRQPSDLAELFTRAIAELKAGPR